MKHLYRNILCILLIIVAACGILLMSLHMTGFLDDNLTFISKAIANGTGNIYDLLDKFLDQEVITVESDYNGLIYLRNESGGDFDPSKNEFTNAKSYKEKYNYNPLGYYAKKNIETEAKKYSLTIKTHKKSLNMLIPNYTDQGLDDEYKENASDYRVRVTMEKDVPYSFSFYPEVNLEEMSKVELPSDVLQDELDYREYVHSTYTHLVKNYNEKDEKKVMQEEQLREQVLDFLDRNGLNPNKSTFIDDVHEYFMKNYTYGDMETKAPNNENLILYFLNNCKRGICNNFASASVYIYRAAGIPTRFVTGYLAMGAMPVNGKYQYSVTKKYCHAWNEVYIDGAGWMRIDNTACRLDLNDTDLDKFQGLISNDSSKDTSLDTSISQSSTSSDSSSSSSSSSSRGDEVRYTVKATLHDISVDYDGTDQNLDSDTNFNEYFKIDRFEDEMTGKVYDAKVYDENFLATDVLNLWTEGYQFQYKFKKSKKMNHIDATDPLNGVPPYGFICEIHVVDANGVNHDDEFDFTLYTEHKSQSIGGLSKANTADGVCYCIVKKRDIHIYCSASVDKNRNFDSQGVFKYKNDISSLCYHDDFPPIIGKVEVKLDSNLKLADFDANNEYSDFDVSIIIYDIDNNDITSNFNIDTDEMVITLTE